MLAPLRRWLLGWLARVPDDFFDTPLPGDEP